MTYCLGLKTRTGIIGLADTRITTGNDTTSAKKIFSVNRKNHSFFIMTSGLRSVRDKAITYFNEVIEEDDESFNKLYKAVNAFAEQVKRVAGEDKSSLEESGLSFNLYAIVGGQLEQDKEPKIYLLYPQGNWIEIGESTPYVIIGNTGYGNPVLKRTFSVDSSMEFGMKCAFLSFDATRLSSNDVDYPIDTISLKNDSYHLIEHRYVEKDLGHLSDYWNSRIKDAIENIPAQVLGKSFKEETDLVQ
ncbi:MAG: peptidase [Cyclobacteriaceae bacterium]